MPFFSIPLAASFLSVCQLVTKRTKKKRVLGRPLRVQEVPPTRSIQIDVANHLLSEFKWIQALVGFEKTIQHLDEYLIEIGSEGIAKHKVRKFRGEEMPLHLSNKKGDLRFKLLAKMHLHRQSQLLK
ncbi:HSP40/DnaJ peptide-binding protein [Dioscorea alata]|uniref:HSP40/DnaJ peptide-binding protein n=1 Tax=Dioscorea alata TaxID=55571 RepID=A0ACB7WNB7_DIOAL|nr:HSP40/DnaJ peptide-binding protein [Dioscorea alata]